MHLLSRLGLFSSLKGMRRTDVLAGVTLAAMAIPEALGYSTLAGMPPVTGLYCMLVPVVVYVVVASSRQLVIGPDSSTAPLVLAAVAPLAAMGSAHFAALAATLSLLVAGILILLFVSRLGVIADFLSRPVLMGFLAGIGITVIVSQLHEFLGLPRVSGSVPTRLIDIAQHIGEVNLADLGIGLLTLSIIIVLERFAPRLPAQLLAVALAVILVAAFDLGAHGVALVGPVTSGLPTFSFPDVGWGEVGRLLVPSLAIVVLIVAQTVATAEDFAFRRDYDVQPARDILGLGLANAAAAFSGTYCVNGSGTKTAVADSAGGRSQLVSLVSVVVVLLVLLWGTGLIALLPNAAIAAVVVMAATRLIDIRGSRDVVMVRPYEFAVAAIGAAGVIFLSITWGFVIAVVLSVADRLRIAHAPNDAVIGEVSEQGWHDVRKRPTAMSPRGMVAYRFSSSLYFPNARRFHERVIELVTSARIRPRWFVLDASAVSDIDYTAAKEMAAAVDDLRQRDVVFAVAEVTDDLRALMDRYGLVKKIGPGHIFETLDLAAEAYARACGAPVEPGAGAVGRDAGTPGDSASDPKADGPGTGAPGDSG
jgi:sulfate permease, SulP family